MSNEEKEHKSREERVKTVDEHMDKSREETKTMKRTISKNKLKSKGHKNQPEEAEQHEHEEEAPHKKPNKHSYLPRKKSEEREEKEGHEEEEGEPTVTIKGKPKDIERFMSPREKEEHHKRGDPYSEKDIEDVKFRPRDDEENNLSPGTPRSPLPSGVEKHKFINKVNDEEAAKLLALQDKISAVSNKHNQGFDN